MCEAATLKENHRIMTICNACRYCEGFCAVWPAMELHRSFTDADLKYFANLCHNCRGCYYACQYAPPHEFMLNAPQSFAQLRKETYAEFTWPPKFAKLYVNNGLTVFIASLLCIFAFIWGSVGAYGMENFFAAHVGANSFYKIIPYWFMLLFFSLALFYAIFAIYKSVRAMWQGTGSNRVSFELKDHFQAAKDCMTLRYLDGGGDGCNYPDAKFGFSRRNAHHLVFYGFILCLISTAIAFVYDHVFHWPAPYSFASLPVFFGTLGGLGMCAGTGILVWLKYVMDRRPADEGSTGMDISFTVLLFLICLTGLLLMILRSGSMMGLMLCLHLGLVMAFFLMLPYSKFMHAVYRYATLVRNAHEQRLGKAV